MLKYDDLETMILEMDEKYDLINKLDRDINIKRVDLDVVKLKVRRLFKDEYNLSQFDYSNIDLTYLIEGMRTNETYETWRQDVLSMSMDDMINGFTGDKCINNNIVY